MKKTERPRSERPRSERPRSEWWLYVLIVLGAGVLGAGIAGFVMSSRTPSPVASSPATPVTTASPDDTNHEPPPMLTSNLSPAQAALTLGNWYFDHKNWPQAIANYQQAIERGADNADIRTDLGSAYRFDKQPQKALKQYRRAQQMNPRHENSLFNQGGLYHFELNDQAAAIARWREYLQKFPQGKNVAEARQLIEETQKEQ